MIVAAVVNGRSLLARLSLGRDSPGDRIKVFLLAVGVEIAFLALIGLGTVHHEVLGVVGAGAALVAVVAASRAGPLVGVGVALAAGAGFFVLVTDLGATAPVSATVLSIGIWSASAAAVGVVVNALRRRVAEREAGLAAALEQAETLQASMDQVLAVTPAFHGAKTIAGASHAVCATALRMFDCDAAELLVVKGGVGETLAFAAAGPALWGKSLRQYGLDESLVVSFRRLAFVEDVAAAFQAEGRLPYESLLVAPVGTGSSDRRILVMAWHGHRSEPDDASLLVVQRFADHVAVALAESARHEAEADAGLLHARLEASLLPRLPLSHPGLEIVTRYIPVEHRMRVGGDFVDVVDLGNDVVSLVVGDVTGHGPDAAALGATLRASWHALALADVDLPTMMRSLERVLNRERAADDIMATLCSARLDLGKKRASVLTAGHPKPILLRPGLEPVEMDTPTALPLGTGLSDVGGWDAQSVDLNDGWGMFFFTDGLVEGRWLGRHDQRFGTDRLLASLHVGVRDGSAAVVVDDVIDRARAANGGPLPDDVAVVFVRTVWPSLSADTAARWPQQRRRIESIPGLHRAFTPSG